MVTITIIIEGGILPSDNADTATMENSQNLRESLNRIFSELLQEEVSIIIQMGAGYRSAASLFVNSKENFLCLYVDLDAPKKDMPAWFQKLENENPAKPIVFSEEKRKKVFFMIQEMEAWILKQPAAIEKWGKTKCYTRLKAETAIEQHTLIKNKDIEEIAQPSHVLSTLVKHFFKRTYNGKNKKVQYGKLKSAPELLDQIDVKELLTKDSELRRFQEEIVQCVSI